MISKLLRILIVILVLALLAAVCWGLTQIYLWPWWWGAVLAASCITLFIVIRQTRRHMLRRREKNFVQRVLHQDQDAIKGSPADNQQQLMALREQWQQAIDQLRHSRLRRHGNPLYVLPWYLMLGESGAGKSTAIKHSGLRTDLTDVQHSPGITSTKHCDWWFFEEAIVLDAAGRYAIPIDPGPDRQEWETFLDLVAQYRQREPFNGILVAMASDRLQQASDKELEEEGQQIRQRLDQLMRVTGANTPVYLLITKADLIYGFEEFSDPLSSDQLSQAMGYLNPEIHQDWHELLENAAYSIQQRLMELQSWLLSQGHKSPGGLLFPSELTAVHQRLQHFFRGLADPNPYQESPLIRGLFYSSARHQGNPASAILESFNLKTQTLQDRDQSLFLKDIFHQILPSERYLFRPVARYLRRHKQSGRLLWMFWLLCCTGVAGVMTFSWQQQQQQLDRLQQHCLSPRSLSSDYSQNLLTLDRLRQEIMTLEQQLPPELLRLGLRGSEKISHQLRRHYVKLFQQDFLDPLDRDFAEDLQRLMTQDASASEIAEYTTFLSARIHLLDALDQSGSDIEYLEQHSTRVLQRLDQNLTPDMALRFIPCFRTYMEWAPVKYDLQEESQRYRASLISLLQSKDQDLHWLVDPWIPEENAVTWQQFWKDLDITTASKTPRVEAAFTKTGYTHIQRYISFLQATLGSQQQVLQKPLARFWPWYHQQYLKAWQQFFDQTTIRPADAISDAQRDQIAARQSQPNPPSWQLLRSAMDNVSVLEKDEQVALWIQQLKQITDVAELATVAEKQREASLLSRLSGSAEKSLNEATNALTRKDRQQLHDQLQRSAHWDQLNQALVKCQQLSQSATLAAQKNQQAFASTHEDNPLVELYQHVNELQQNWPASELPKSLWSHILQPANYLLDWALWQSGKKLEEQWQHRVIGQLIGMDAQRRNSALFEPKEGLAWQFLEQQAAPFVQRTEDGFLPRQALDRSVPLNKAFFTWLNQGRRLTPVLQDSYTLQLDSLPTNVNPGAKIEPYAVNVTLHCNEGATVLKNFNYPSSQTFDWKPKSCGDSELTIEFPTFTLQRDYSGTLGFVQLMAELADGHQRYATSLWPDQLALSQQNNLEWIDVNFKVRGANELVQLLQQPINPPKNLVE